MFHLRYLTVLNLPVIFLKITGDSANQIDENDKLSRKTWHKRRVETILKYKILKVQSLYFPKMLKTRLSLIQCKRIYVGLYWVVFQF